MNNDIGKRIKQRRVALGITQDDLAKKIGYTDRSSIAKIENGEASFTIERLNLMAAALGTTTQEFLGISHEKQIGCLRLRIQDIRKRLEDLQELIEMHAGMFKSLSEYIDAQDRINKTLAGAIIELQGGSDET